MRSDIVLENSSTVGSETVLRCSGASQIDNSSLQIENGRERRVAEWSEPRFLPGHYNPSTRVWRAVSSAVPMFLWIELLRDAADERSIPLFVFAISAATLLAGCSIWTRGAAQAPSREDLDAHARLLAETLPDSARGFAATIHLTVGGYEYGQDTGLIALVDGWLIFEGRQSDFSLAPHDCDGYWQRETDGNFSRDAEFSIVGIYPNVRVRVSPVDWQGSAKRLIVTWMSGQVSGPAISVLPPLEPIPIRVERKPPAVARFLIFGSLLGMLGSGLVWLVGAPVDVQREVLRFLFIAMLGVGGALGIMPLLTRATGQRSSQRQVLDRLARARDRVLAEQAPPSSPDLIPDRTP